MSGLRRSSPGMCPVPRMIKRASGRRPSPRGADFEAAVDAVAAAHAAHAAWLDGLARVASIRLDQGRSRERAAAVAVALALRPRLAIEDVLRGLDVPAPRRGVLGDHLVATLLNSPLDPKVGPRFLEYLIPIETMDSLLALGDADIARINVETDCYAMATDTVILVCVPR